VHLLESSSKQPDFRRQKAERITVSAASSRLIESSRLQKAEGGRRRSGECIYEKANRISETSEGRRRKA